MIKVITPNDAEFLDYEDQLKKMYENSQIKITDPNPFEFIRNNTLFYGFLDVGESDAPILIGAVYCFMDEGKLFLNGFAGRKHFDKNCECLRLSKTWFKCDIYAEAQNRASALCLLKSGFKRLKGNLFVLKK